VLEKPRFYAVRFVLPPFNKPAHTLVKKFILK